MSKKTHVVDHPSLYMMVGGKMTEMAVGTELTLDKKTGERMENKGFVKKISDAKPVDLSDGSKLKTENTKLKAKLAKLEKEKNTVGDDLAKAVKTIEELSTRKGK